MDFKLKIIMKFLILLSLLTMYPVFADNVENKLRPGDEINVLIVGYDEFQGTFLIKSDGTIELPIVGNLKVADLTLEEFKNRVIEKISQYIITEPQVILTANYRVSVFGEVNKPGSYKINGTEKLSDLLAMAGGLTERARLNKAKITRDNKVIVSNFKDVIKKGKSLSDIGIHSGDIIFISKSWWADWDLKSILVPLTIVATSLVIYDRVNK